MTIENSNQAEALNQIRAKGQRVLAALDEILGSDRADVVPELAAIRAEQSLLIEEFEKAVGLEPVQPENKRNRSGAPGAPESGDYDVEGDWR